jgi:hypothetical protein
MVFAALVAVAPALSAQEAKVDITGKWDFQVETSAGGGSPTVTFKQDGEKIGGHYAGQLGESDFTGTVKGKAINFGFTLTVQGQSVAFTYAGTIESGQAMKGTVELAGVGTGTFTGKR